MAKGSGTTRTVSSANAASSRKTSTPINTTGGGNATSVTQTVKYNGQYMNNPYDSLNFGRTQP